MPTKPLMTFESPAGDDLLFSSLRGSAELGRPYEYEVTLLSRNPSVDLRSLVGQRVAVELGLPDGTRRKFHGYVVRFRQTGMRGRYHVYQASLRPWLWLLRRRTNSRIYPSVPAQSGGSPPPAPRAPLTAKGVVEHVFNDKVYQRIDFGAGIDWHIQNREMPERDFWVQYRESDFNFVSRLLEDEGVHYWFWDKQGDEQMRIADTLSAHDTVPGYETLPFGRLQDDNEVVHAWRPRVNLRTPAARVMDYDFTHPPPLDPGAVLNMQLDRQHLDLDVQLDDFPDLELFEYPARFLTDSQGGSRAMARADEAGADWCGASGETNARGLAVGTRFKLEGHPRAEQNDEYVVIRAEYELDFADYEGLDDTPQLTRYTCRFDALPAFRPYAPARSTPRPRVRGPETAIVAGPAGEEIHTDEYGRVKVQFLWDREGTQDENSSCYVRVSHPWAGNQWGMIAIPRIGQEVIVDFLQGDPDRPIITGRVYNAANMPPYDLPLNKTQTGIKTRSTPGGTIQNFNELRFEDKKGEEQVYIHAERNMDVKVENDSSLSVDANRAVSVGASRTTTIKGDFDKLFIKNKHHVEVDKGEDYTVKEGGQVIRVNSGGQYLGSKSGKQEFYTDTGQQVTVLGSEGQKVYVQGGQGVTVTDGDAVLYVSGHDRKVGASNIEHVAMAGDINQIASNTYFAQGADLKFKSTGQVLFACDGDFKIMNGGSYSVTNMGSTTATKLGSWTDLTVSIGNTTSLALTNATSMGLTNSTSISLKLDTSVGVSFGCKLSADLSNTLLKVDSAGMNTELATLKLINGGGGGGGGGGGAAGPYTGWGIASIVGSIVSGAASYFNLFSASGAITIGAFDHSDGKTPYQAAWEKAGNSIAEGFYPDISPPAPPTADEQQADRDASLPPADPAAAGQGISLSAPSAGTPR
ncbi:type VI secretion system spike protein VgrG1b [Pigmentiphaga soli]|uniref:Type VI secretion system spike protein VgrG1b n=1 Tax=Pigmentiphaga soli TaxID=1007095 RepID=A0ABP8HPB3_9BURK